MNKSRFSGVPHAGAKRCPGASSDAPSKAPGKTAKPSRAAYAQPRLLIAAMLLMLGATIWWAVAKTSSGSTTTTDGGTTAQKAYELSDLPALVESYGKAKGGATTRKFALTEVDITPNSPSDERQPAFRPNGDLIAFVSNGKDTDNDGHIDALNADGGAGSPRYHIWLMNPNGTGQRQITGLTTSTVVNGQIITHGDKDRDQAYPSWSPDGNQLVYIDTGIYQGPQEKPNGNTPVTKSELFVTRPLDNGNPTERRTFSGGEKRGASWSPSGQAIAFASDTYPVINSTTNLYDNLNEFDIYTIAPTGEESTVVQLTGTKGDPSDPFNNTDELNPAYALVNQNVVYFSTNMTTGAGPTYTPTPLGTNERRIWKVDATGLNRRQITDPTVRPGYNGNPVIDDFPSPSLATIGENLSFQSTSRIDASDDVQDFNVWSMSLNSNQFQPAPTPQPTPDPALAVSEFTSSFVETFNSDNDGSTRGTLPTVNLSNPEGLAYARNGNPPVLYLYVSNRNNGSVDRYVAATGDPAPSGTNTGAVFAKDGTLINPTGLVISGGNLYVADGGDPSLATQPKYVVHRFSLDSGAANPATGQTGSIFTHGEPTGQQMTVGASAATLPAISGITFGPDTNLYVAASNQNRINAFDTTGTFIGTGPYVAAGSGGLAQPMGIAFGPADGNLYVASSGSDQVLRYVGPNNGTGSVNPGDPIDAFITDTNGTTFGLNAPRGIVFGPNGTLANANTPPGTTDLQGAIYVSSFNSVGPDASTSGRGRAVLRFSAATANTPLPSVTGTTIPGANTNATFARTAGQGAGFLAFNPSALVAPFVPTPTPPTIVEGGGDATVESNTLSSPTAFQNSGLSTPDTAGQPVGEDTAADREPTYSRSTAGDQTTATIAFASQRRTAGAPGNTLNPDGTVNPAPVVVNPNGGAQNLPEVPTSAGTAPTPGKLRPAGMPPTHDIWTTITQDSTPPILLPQGVGNQTFPVLSPGPQAASAGIVGGTKRTPDTGLTANSQIVVAVVIKEQESGLASNLPVTATFRDANQPQFNTSTSKVNDGLLVTFADEQKPRAVAQNLNLATYDDGPLPNGHERESGAVKGDGIYYCEGTFTTPSATSDYYIDITARDQAGNSITYDDIWGFSTSPFNPSATGTSDLFVSDYTVGQDFPQTLTQDKTGRFSNLRPVESYWLTNPKGGTGSPATGGSVGGDVIAGTPLAIVASSNKTTFGNVDIWRILCRGEVPQRIFDTYTPTTTQQLDPADFANGPNDNAQLTRTLAVAKRAIIWASPYTGVVFAGPGTLKDAATQSRLQTFLSQGGRLFVSGWEVIYGLSGAFSSTNTFLNEDLQATPNGESTPDIITAAGGSFSGDLQIPTNPAYSNGSDTNNSWRDAALNKRGADLIGAGTGAATVTTAYTLNGSPVGTRIVRQRASSIESRVVLFTFGFEAVNRRYTAGPPIAALNVRTNIANGIDSYFRTGGLSGTVFNANTNQTIPNFIVQVNGPGGRYYARTDTSGNYSLLGLPPGTYTVSLPTYTSGGQTFVLNPGYISNDTGSAFNVGNGNVTQNANLNVIPTPTGSLQGQVYSSNGTLTDRRDDTPVNGVPVLVKSRFRVPSLPSGGKFARIVQTDAGGRFTVDNVPADVDLIVVLNPNDRVESDTGQADGGAAGSESAGDIPDNSGLAYGRIGTNPALSPRTDLRRRAVPDTVRPDVISAISGDFFILNDGPNDTKVDDPTVQDTTTNPPTYKSGGPLLLPVGPTISGVVTLNGAPVGGATVTLTRTAGGAAFTRIGTSQSDGTYSFVDLFPGTYKIVATGPSPYQASTATITEVLAMATSPDITNANLPLFKQDVFGKALVNNVGQAGLKVLLIPTGSTTGKTLTVATDAAGNYRFTNVKPGTYKVSFTQGSHTVTQTVTVTQGQDTQVPTLRIFIQNITGRVTLALLPAAPVPTKGATVSLLQNNALVKKTVTDANGNYTFADVPAGSYTIQVTQFGDDITRNITVKAGQNLTIPDLVLMLETISGRVTLELVPAAPTPTQGAIVQLFQNGTVIRTLKTAADGTYAFTRLVAGTYQVRASQFGDQTPLATAKVVRGRNVALPDLVLTLQTVSGRVLVNGRVSPGALVTLFQNGTAFAALKTDANGNYSFSRIPAGNYTITATQFGDSVSLDIVVARLKNVTVPDLRLFRQTITGFVFVNGAPEKGATVTLTATGFTTRTTLTGANGGYTFANVPPGTYTVTGTSRGDTASVQVTLPRGKDMQAPDILLVLETLTGHITATGGAPVSGAVVKLTGPQKGTVTTGTDGAYSFSLLPAGTYTVFASKFSSAGQVTVTRSATVTIARGTNATQDIQLPLQIVSGIVTLNGTPIGNAVVQLLKNGTATAATKSASNGTYSFAEVAAGSYVLRASITGDSVDLPITVRDDVNLPNQNLALLLESISGTVSLNNLSRGTRAPSQGATVQLLQNGKLIQRTTSGADGTYSFSGLTVGSYTLRAIQFGDSVDLAVTVQRGRNLTGQNLVLVLQGIAGTVSLQNGPTLIKANGATVRILTTDGTEVERVMTDANGNYFLFDLPATVAGTRYTVTASLSGDSTLTSIILKRGAPLPGVNLRLVLVQISGVVQLNMVPTQGITVQLVRTLDGLVLQSKITNAKGQYIFGPVAAGSYTIQATSGTGANEVTSSEIINAPRSPLFTAPTLFLTGTGGSGGNSSIVFSVGQIYQISIPYADSAAAAATTTVDKAFSLPVMSGSAQNYRINRWDATTQSYVELKGSDTLQRGVGYFLEPLSQDISLRTPDVDATRIPTAVTQFPITLHRSATASPSSTGNGYNLIGDPFNPAVFAGADWLNSQVIVPKSTNFPNGATFNTVSDAVAAGVLDSRLFISDPTTNDYIDSTETGIESYKGYYVRTFIDGVQVVLKPIGTQ